MVAVLLAGEVVERVRKDAERNVLRVRNGLKHLAGVGRPELTQTPKETVWSAEKVELWHYPSDRVHDPHAAAVRAQPRVAQLRVRPRARQQLHRDDARLAASTSTSIDWGVPDELESGNTLETYTDGYIPTIVAEVQRRLRRPGRQPVRLLLRRRPVAAVGRRQPVDLPIRSLAVMATPIDIAPHGPDDGDDAGRPRRARGPPRRDAATCPPR